MSKGSPQKTKSSKRNAAEVLRVGLGQTSITAIAVALSKDKVAAIAIREKRDDEALLTQLRKQFPRAELVIDAKGTRDVIRKIVAFVERPDGNLNLPLDIRGTDFQKRVWKAVMKVPFGRTTSFAKIAEQTGSPRAIRAVGSACTRNPLEFAIPCHRVLRSDGSFSGGSAWGDRRQEAIVRREAASVSTSSSSRLKGDCP
jgi:AraC family transcriptional regulator of adaptative response/methylated-DNA-[protein]-cysteine methyltransferase